MSEISSIDIIKENEQEISVIVRSFRDDSLPNPDLKEKQDITTTGFVLFCDILFNRHSRKGQKMLAELYEELKEIYSNNFYGFDKYPKPEITNHFIESAKIIELRRNPGDDYHFNIEDWTQKYNLTNKQRKQLFDLMEFEEEDYTLEDNFSIYFFKGGSNYNIAKIIGEESYEKIQPLIHISLKFKNPKHIEKLYNLSSDTTLDSYINSWMPKDE